MVIICKIIKSIFLLAVAAAVKRVLKTDEARTVGGQCECGGVVGP